MKIDRIFVANLAETADFLVKLMGRKQGENEIFEDHALSDRFIASSGDNSILITPFPLDKQYFKDIATLLGYKYIANLSPKKTNGSTCLAILKDKKLLKKVIDLIRKNPRISLIAYAATPQFVELVSYLKSKSLIFETPEMPVKESRWTSLFFDSKAGFRQSVPYLGKEFPPMPMGFVCRKRSDIIGWARYFMKKSGGFVLKTDHGLAGAGVRIVRKKDIKDQNLEAFVNDILESEPYWQEELTVVEEFIKTDQTVAGGNPSVEYQVKKGKILPLYVCGMRVTGEGVFRGVEIGKGAVPANLCRILLEAGEKWAKFLQEVGYRGFFDIDWVYDKNGRLYPIESNLRRTGGTHVFEIGQRILGENFLEKYCLVANNITKAPRFANKEYSYIKKKLAPLLYPIKNKREGVILTDISYLVRGNLGYIVIGSDKAKAFQIENKFLEQLTI